MRRWRLLLGFRTLRRIAVALEKLVAIEEQRLEIERQRVSPVRPKRPKIAEVFVPSIEDANEIYREEHGYGPWEEG
jgi:hypothetical protein